MIPQNLEEKIYFSFVCHTSYRYKLSKISFQKGKIYQGVLDESAEKFFTWVWIFYNGSEGDGIRFTIGEDKEIGNLLSYTKFFHESVEYRDLLIEELLNDI